MGVKDVMPIYLAYVRSCADWSLHLEVVVDENNEVKGVLFGSDEDPDFWHLLKLYYQHTKTNVWVLWHLLMEHSANAPLLGGTFQNIKK